MSRHALMPDYMRPALRIKYGSPEPALTVLVSLDTLQGDIFNPTLPAGLLLQRITVSFLPEITHHQDPGVRTIRLQILQQRDIVFFVSVQIRGILRKLDGNHVNLRREEPVKIGKGLVPVVGLDLPHGKVIRHAEDLPYPVAKLPADDMEIVFLRLRRRHSPVVPPETGYPVQGQAVPDRKVVERVFRPLRSPGDSVQFMRHHSDLLGETGYHLCLPALMPEYPEYRKTRNHQHGNQCGGP